MSNSQYNKNNATNERQIPNMSIYEIIAFVDDIADKDSFKAPRIFAKKHNAQTYLIMEAEISETDNVNSARSKLSAWLVTTRGK